MPETLLKAAIIPVTPYRQNCSLVWCTKTGDAAVVDPGGDLARIQDAVAANGITVKKVLLTHGHLDHAGGAAGLARALGVPIEGPHPDDSFLLEALSEHGRRPGFQGSESCTPDRWLADGDTVSLGEIVLGVRHCPGHTPGHVVLYHEEAKLAFVGDVLFRGSVGRTDFPRGDAATLINSIVTKLWPFGDDIVFVPGHGPASSFGQERRTNPYVADQALRRA